MKKSLHHFFIETSNSTLSSLTVALLIVASSPCDVLIENGAAVDVSELSFKSALKSLMALAA